MRARIFIGVVVLLAVFLAWNYFRPLPAVAATTTLAGATTITGTAPSLPWPSVGSGAVGVSGLGPLASSGNEQPGPSASVAKVMTALVLLIDKPLKAGESGPSLTLTDQDVQAYEADRAQQQSVVAVTAGEQLTELQAMEAMLIPSANNIAETLARWDAGSVTAFVGKMNTRAKTLGLSKTKFADPAGASTDTVSTPSDLLRLGMTAMQQPAFAQVVKLPQVVLPVAGVVYNVNGALGLDGIVGIKTGSGLQLGANFLFAAAVTISGHPVTIFGCVMGQPTLAIAFVTARDLIRAVQPALTVKQVLARNQSVGAYDTPWSEHTDVLSTFDVNLVEWPGMILRQRLDAPTLSVDKGVPAGSAAGNMHIVLGDYRLDVPLATSTAVFPPGKVWRITRLPWTNS